MWFEISGHPIQVSSTDDLIDSLVEQHNLGNLRVILVGDQKIFAAVVQALKRQRPKELQGIFPVPGGLHFHMNFLEAIIKAWGEVLLYP